jgi:heptose I phosphotransferase
VGWGGLSDGRSFVITEDLAGFDAADKLLRDGSLSFEQLLEPTADLAAKLHGRGLHHRDLYLCHFFVRVDDQALDVRLIDVGRVRALPGLLTRRRWIVKDLAQFWFSTTEVESIANAQRAAWLNRYAHQRSVDASTLRSAIERKSAWIARHDTQLRKLQPNRNISIPG